MAERKGPEHKQLVDVLCLARAAAQLYLNGVDVLHHHSVADIENMRSIPRPETLATLFAFYVEQGALFMYRWGRVWVSTK